MKGHTYQVAELIDSSGIEQIYRFWIVEHFWTSDGFRSRFTNKKFIDLESAKKEIQVLESLEL